MGVYDPATFGTNATSQFIEDVIRVVLHADGWDSGPCADIHVTSCAAGYRLTGFSPLIIVAQAIA